MGPEEGAEAVEEEGGKSNSLRCVCFYLDPTRCTLNVSPRGHFTLFFFLQ